MSSKKNASDNHYDFVLYIDSAKPRSFHVVDRLRQLCEENLIDSYNLKVIDLREDQTLFERHHIIAAPTLDVTTPNSQQHRFIGDLSQSEMFIIAIGMNQKAVRMGEDAVKMRNDIKTP